jgi:hypothetical protein
MRRFDFPITGLSIAAGAKMPDLAAMADVWEKGRASARESERVWT